MRFIAVSILFLIQSSVVAQVKFYTRVDQPVVGRNQPVELQYIVENANSVEDFRPPDFRDFKLIQGPIQSSGMSIVNGNSTQYKSLVYLLQPKNAGKLRIKGATAKVNGKQMRSNNVVVQVTNQNPVPSQNTGPAIDFSFPGDRAEVEPQFYLKPGENMIEKIKQNLFVKVEVSKVSCFVNEPVVATYKLYSRLRSESRVVKRPSYNGFSVYDMIEPDGSVRTTEVLNGKEYNVHLIRQSQLFPLQAGTYTLDPIQVENVVSFVKTDVEDANSFDEIFNPRGDIVEQTVNLSSKPVTIRVMPLPLDKQPADFDGAVGNFHVTSSLSKDSVHAGEMASLTVRVKGKGNLQIINAPGIAWPKDVEGYDPKTEEQIHPETVPLSGEKIYRFPITAKREGEFLFEPIHFSFFDPTSQSYKTDSTQPIMFHALAALPGQRKAIPFIKPLKTTFQDKLILLIAFAIVLLMTGIWVVLSFRANKRKKKNEEALAQREKEKLAARPDPLEKARQLLSTGDQIGFLKEIENAIWKEAGHQLQIPSTSLNQAKVMDELRSRGASDSAALFRELVNNFETTLYIPGASSANLQDILEMGNIFIQQLGSLKA